MKNALPAALTAINLILLVVLLSHTVPSASAEPAGAAEQAPALRARSLEIVDDHGRVRALLAVMPPAVVEGKQYPETVLLRLIDPKSGPVVKLTAAADGAALLLSDDADGGVSIMARDRGTSLTLTQKDGTKAVLPPAK